jgi:CRP-like cAMP-binding protein
VINITYQRCKFYAILRFAKHESDEFSQAVMNNETNSIGHSCYDCKDISCAASVLNLKELEQLNANSHESFLKKGEVILLEGPLTTHIIYLKSGLVKVYIKHSDDKKRIVQIVKAHAYLGLPSLFGNELNHYYYTALEDCKICYIDVTVFNNLIRENGNFAYKILVSLSRESLNNINKFLPRSQNTIYIQVADAILYFSKIVYGANHFELPISQQEFADLTGISRKSTTKALLKFKSEGIINIHERFITILDMDLLEQIGQMG